MISSVFATLDTDPNEARPQGLMKLSHRNPRKR